MDEKWIIHPARSLRECGALAAIASCILALAFPAHALTLEQAISIALDTNPQIGQAIENREAVEFELRQARGLYMPRVDVEASSGPRKLDSPGRRLSRLDNNTLDQQEIGGTVAWKLFDGFNREAQIERQASRVDGASHRVWERSEFIALAIAKEYFEILLQAKIAEIAESNLAYHRRISDRIRRGVAGGSLTAADIKQAMERLKAAEARSIQARDELSQARSHFFALVAQPPSGLGVFRNLSASLPRSYEIALSAARIKNPQIKIAEADLDAARALVKAARAKYYPEISLEGRIRSGNDIDGVENRTNDMQAKVVTRFNLFNGGIDAAGEQEQIRRLGEAQLRLQQIQRDVEEAVRTAWDKRINQASLVGTLKSQAQLGKGVVDAYEEQFTAGRRSLLDLLSAQNTYVNTLVVGEIARYAELFAAYRVMAAMGELLPSLGLRPSLASAAYAREQARVPQPAADETMRRYSPDRSSGYGIWRTEVTR